jgi:serine/threonine protein kinase
VRAPRRGGGVAIFPPGENACTDAHGVDSEESSYKFYSGFVFHFIQIATALRFCHRNRIIHRDLKLENCLIDERANAAHLGDFGSACFVHDEVDVNGSTSSGSEAYAAPEILSSSLIAPKSSMRTDIWSLGILLYGMLTGDAPWEVAHPDRDETYAYYLHHSGAFLFEHRPEISDEVRDLVLGMLAVNPEERLDIHEVMSHPWLE